MANGVRQPAVGDPVIYMLPTPSGLVARPATVLGGHAPEPPELVGAADLNVQVHSTLDGWPGPVLFRARVQYAAASLARGHSWHWPGE